MGTTEQQQVAFNAYLAARDRAIGSGDFKDGVAAGRAWRAFLDVFLDSDQERKVIPLFRGKETDQ